MIKDKKLVVVMPAYNAEKSLEKTFAEIPHEIVDDGGFRGDDLASSQAQGKHFGIAQQE